MRIFALVAVLLVAAPAFADDEQLDLQGMRFVERGEDLTVTASITKLFDSAAYAALGSGFLTTVEVQIWVYEKDSTEPVAYSRIKRTVVYDMWDEVYTVKVCDACKPVKVKSPAAALKLLSQIVDEPVAKLVDIPYGSADDNLFYLAIRADLNPVSKQTLAEVRRWLSQGTGGGLDRGSVFFGNFVSVFVNPKIAEADRVLRVRSQPFYRPRPSP